MKVSPKADYPVKVVAEPSEHEPPLARLYEGVYTAVLNHVVEVLFVPDISALAPPWDDHLLPGSVDELTPELAALATALLATYVVTPNDALAGRDESFELPPDGDVNPSHGVVFYVTPAEFARYAVELARLAELNEDSFYAKETVSALRGYDVIAFVEGRVLASRWLAPRDAIMLGRATA
jgi:hypothetical protein